MDHKTSSQKTENGQTKLDEWVNVRVSTEQRDAIEAAAKKEHRKAGPFVRLLVMKEVGSPELIY